MKYTRYLCVGPGGRRCPCCFPGPKGKRYKYRKAKRRDERDIAKEIREELICE